MKRYLVAVILTLCLPFAALAGQDDLRRTPVVRAVQKVAPAVVNITTARVVERSVNPFGDMFPEFSPFFRDFGGTRKFRSTSLGSGVIIDGRQRLAVSNAHVIAGASEISVRLQDGREFSAELVGSDPDFDLAVLKLEGAGPLPEAELGNSDTIWIGETVIAIGNPYGFSHTVTTGVISARGRSVQTKQGVYTDFLQTDAAINPGNSGGPLLNILGQVIGINTAIRADAQGIGFAIPANKAKRVVEELIESGSVAHIWLGLCGQDLDQASASYFGLREVAGMIVTDVYTGTPADRADIRPGDVLLEVNANRVADKQAYLDILRNYTQGERLTLTMLRGSETIKVTVRGERFDPALAEELAEKRWGFRLSDRRGRAGFPIAEVRSGGPADRLGLRAGDVVNQIGGVRLNDRDDFSRAVMRYRLHGTILMKVARGNRWYHVKMGI